MVLVDLAVGLLMVLKKLQVAFEGSQKLEVGF